MSIFQIDCVCGGSGVIGEVCDVDVLGQVYIAKNISKFCFILWLASTLFFGFFGGCLCSKNMSKFIKIFIVAAGSEADTQLKQKWNKKYSPKTGYQFLLSIPNCQSPSRHSRSFWCWPVQADCGHGGVHGGRGVVREVCKVGVLALILALLMV